MYPNIIKKLIINLTPNDQTQRRRLAVRWSALLGITVLFF